MTNCRAATRKFRALLQRCATAATALRGARWGMVAACCGVSLAAALWYGAPQGWAWFASHPYFAIATIEVDGARQLGRQEILRRARVRLGTSIWDAAPSVIHTRLQRHPWIERVSVQRQFPRRVRIRVQEREPVAIARLGTLQYVDGRGRILGPLRRGDTRDLPVITGIDDAEIPGFGPIALRRAVQVLRWCRRTTYFGDVSEVHVDRHRGVTIFPLRMTVAVVLGWGGWRQKLARSARVVAAWEGQWGRLAVLDASFRGMVVATLREEDHPAVMRSSKRGVRV